MRTIVVDTEVEDDILLVTLKDDPSPLDRHVKELLEEVNDLHEVVFGPWSWNIVNLMTCQANKRLHRLLDEKEQYISLARYNIEKLR